MVLTAFVRVAVIIVVRVCSEGACGGGGGGDGCGVGVGVGGGGGDGGDSCRLLVVA